tara:strand:+ start:7656 stop:8021 length:366 start_codon:yes stop_codon:yes gene_type:complete
MLTSSDELLKNYFWKYVDINVNIEESNYLKSIIYQNSEWIDFFTKYQRYFKNTNEVINFSIIVSQLEDTDYKRFIKFYLRNCKRILNSNDNIIENIHDLQRFIADDETKFKLFIVCLYYYF